MLPHTLDPRLTHTCVDVALHDRGQEGDRRGVGGTRQRWDIGEPRATARAAAAATTATTTTVAPATALDAAPATGGQRASLYRPPRSVE